MGYGLLLHGLGCRSMGRLVAQAVDPLVRITSCGERLPTSKRRNCLYGLSMAVRPVLGSHEMTTHITLIVREMVVIGGTLAYDYAFCESEGR